MRLGQVAAASHEFLEGLDLEPYDAELRAYLNTSLQQLRSQWQNYRLHTAATDSAARGGEEGNEGGGEGEGKIARAKPAPPEPAPPDWLPKASSPRARQTSYMDLHRGPAVDHHEHTDNPLHHHHMHQNDQHLHHDPVMNKLVNTKVHTMPGAPHTYIRAHHHFPLSHTFEKIEPLNALDDDEINEVIESSHCFVCIDDLVETECQFWLQHDLLISAEEVKQCVEEMLEMYHDCLSMLFLASCTPPAEVKAQAQVHGTSKASAPVQSLDERVALWEHERVEGMRLKKADGSNVLVERRTGAMVIDGSGDLGSRLVPTPPTAPRPGTYDQRRDLVRQETAILAGTRISKGVTNSDGGSGSPSLVSSGTPNRMHRTLAVAKGASVVGDDGEQEGGHGEEEEASRHGALPSSGLRSNGEPPTECVSKTLSMSGGRFLAVCESIGLLTGDVWAHTPPLIWEVSGAAQRKGRAPPEYDMLDKHNLPNVAADGDGESSGCNDVPIGIPSAVGSTSSQGAGACGGFGSNGNGGRPIEITSDDENEDGTSHFAGGLIGGPADAMGEFETLISTPKLDRHSLSANPHDDEPRRDPSVTSVAETATLLANRATAGPNRLLFPQFVEGLLKITLERFRPIVPADWEELLKKLRQQKAEGTMSTGTYGSGLEFGRSLSSFTPSKAGSNTSSAQSLVPNPSRGPISTGSGLGLFPDIPSPRGNAIQRQDSRHLLEKGATKKERERERQSRNSAMSAMTNEQQRAERGSGESGHSMKSTASDGSNSSKNSMWSTRSGRERCDRLQPYGRQTHQPPLELTLKELRECLDITLVDDRVQYAFDRYLLTDSQLHSEQPRNEDAVLDRCSQVLARYRIRLHKLFRFFGVQDPTHKFMDLREFVYMCRVLSLTNHATLTLQRAARIAVAVGNVVGLTTGHHLTFRGFQVALCQCAITASQSGLCSASRTVEYFFATLVFPAAEARTSLAFAKPAIS